MKPKFTYTGIRVKDLDESIAFYSGMFGMKLQGRDKIAATKGEAASLTSEEGGFPELNYYAKGSPFAKRYVVGEGWTTSASGWGTLTRSSPGPRRKVTGS